MTRDLVSEEIAFCRHQFVWRAGNETMLEAFEGWLGLILMEKQVGRRSWPFEVNFQRCQIRQSLNRLSRRQSQIRNLQDLRVRLDGPCKIKCRWTYYPRASQNRSLRWACLHGGGSLHYSGASPSGSERVVPQHLGTWHQGRLCTLLTHERWLSGVKKGPAAQHC